MSELELKFQVDPARRDAVRAALQSAPRLHLVAHYHDSPDGRLGQHGTSLRVRREGVNWVQTVKAAGDNVVHRLEENVVRPGRWSAEGPPPDIRLHDGTAAGEALLAALSKKEPLELRRRHSTDVERRALTLTLPDATIEVAYDEGVIVAGERSLAVCEVEYELKEGEVEGLLALARQGVLEHGLWLDTTSKAARGDRLARGEDETPVAKALPPRLDAGMGGAALRRAALRPALDAVLANAGAVAAGHHDEELVHQLRVAIRRVRTVLREMAALAPGVDAAWDATLAATFRALGAWRDHQTVVPATQQRLQAVGAPPVDLQALAGEPPVPADVVREPAFQLVLIDLLGLLLRAGDEGLDPAGARKHLRGRLRKLHRDVARDGRGYEALEPPLQHRVRKRLKRLRYLAEAVASLFGRDDVERYLARLRPAQDALGAHNDDGVAQALYRRAAEQGAGEAWFAVGWLQAQRDAGARACRKALKAVAGAPKFW